VTEIGAQYAEQCVSYIAASGDAVAAAEAPTEGKASSDVDVDDILLQVMPDREKIGRLARLSGTLRYAMDGGDVRLIEETVAEMQQVARHLSEKFRPAELIAAAKSPEPRAAQLAEVYLERCYRLVDEDYAALAELDTRIDELKGA